MSEERMIQMTLDEFVFYTGTTFLAGLIFGIIVAINYLDEFNDE